MPPPVGGGGERIENAGPGRWVGESHRWVLFCTITQRGATIERNQAGYRPLCVRLRATAGDMMVLPREKNDDSTAGDLMIPQYDNSTMAKKDVSTAGENDDSHSRNDALRVKKQRCVQRKPVLSRIPTLSLSLPSMYPMYNPNALPPSQHRPSFAVDHIGSGSVIICSSRGSTKKRNVARAFEHVHHPSIHQGRFPSSCRSAPPGLQRGVSSSAREK